MISVMLKETSTNGSSDGADLFFPVSIYLILQLRGEFAECAKLLKTNIVYIRMFRHEDRLHGEDEYYLTSFESALEFVQNITMGDLKLE